MYLVNGSGISTGYVEIRFVCGVPNKYILLIRNQVNTFTD